MPRIIKSGLIQMSLPKTEGEGTIQEIVNAMVDKHIPYIEEAGNKAFKSCVCRKFFNTPHFCPLTRQTVVRVCRNDSGTNNRAYGRVRQKYNMVIIVPIYEKKSKQACLQHGSGD